MLRFSRLPRIACVLAVGATCLAGCSKHRTSGTASGGIAELTGGEKFGAPPNTDAEPVDIYTVYHLPRLRDQPSGPLNGSLTHLKSIARARDMGLISRSALRAWQSSPPLARLAQETELKASGEVAFNGAKASELNRLLAAKSVQAVRVDSKSITADEPISIARSDIRLDLRDAVVRGDKRLSYLLVIQKAQSVDIRGGVFLVGDSAILIAGSERVRVSDVTIRGLDGTGVVVTDSSAVVVRRSDISGLKYAGIVLHRGVTGSVVEQNRIHDNTGTANLASAILLTDREVDLASNAKALYGPDGYHAARQPLAMRRHPPSGNLIQDNRLERNQARGIDSDGGVRNVIASNTVAGNAKEGICLENSSLANVIAANVVRQNGRRWGEPDAVLRMENLAGKERLADGTPATKLPGLALDNALYNIVFQNTFANNYGGGIRMVRTGLLNVVGMNTVIADWQPLAQSSHSYGIELGAAPADRESDDIDITPARGNVLFSNLIRGPHYAGIYFAEGSDENELVDNTIMDSVKWALESVRPMANTTVNNLTNLRSKNVAPGIDPNLFTIGQPVFDYKPVPLNRSISAALQPIP